MKGEPQEQHDDDMPTMPEVAALVEQAMRDDDADDPLLESYQSNVAK
jgi:hypothetical protein